MGRNRPGSRGREPRTSDSGLGRQRVAGPELAGGDRAAQALGDLEPRRHGTGQHGRLVTGHVRLQDRQNPVQRIVYLANVDCIQYGERMRAVPDAEIGRAIPEHVARLLRDEIVFGRLAPNTRLTEEEVAATYGVSRSPVREGLRLLERDGLVLRSARRGIWVAPLSLKDFDEVYQCRIGLEALAAEGAARQASPAAEKAELMTLLARLEAAEAQGDIPTLFRTDVEASEVIYRLSRNATLYRLLMSLDKQALRYRFFAYAHCTKVVQMSLDGSRRIFPCICRGEARQAHDLTARLIRDIWLTMRPIIADAFPEAG